MAHDLLHGYAVAAFETAQRGGQFEQLSDDVETFATALTDSAQLRRVLTDPLIAEGTRRAIGQDLLRDRAVEPASAIIDFALRVVQPTELPVAIADTLGFAALFRDGEQRPAAGRFAVRARIRGYAERVLEEVPETAEIDEIEDELFRFSRLVATNPPLRRVLANPESALAGRRAVLGDLVENKVRPATFRLLAYVLAAGAVRDLVGTYEWLVELAAEERGRRVAQVRAAVELSDEERSRLADALGRLVHRNVEVRVIEDPSVIGGVQISVGDLLIDGTVRLRFERLRDAIAQWA